MRARTFIFAVLALALAVGCRGTHEDAPRAPPALSPDAAEAPRSGPTPTLDAPAAAQATDAAAPASTKLMPDEEVGPLLTRLSEKPGDFPSENYVTNETSLLHVAQVLRTPALRGRAYVGVGPEQNYTYLAMLEPRVSYIVDIRRGNLLEHMMFRGCFEAGKTRAEFLSALLARRPRTTPEPEPGAGFAPVETAFHGVASDPAIASPQDAEQPRTKALLDRLAVPHTAADDKALARIHDAFAKYGLSIAYTMSNSERKYPSLGENFAAHEPDGGAASFLASEETYARVRRLVVENRVLPIVGNFGGTHALRAVADDIRARSLLLGVFYASNVEQYLFEQRTYGAFVTSVTAMPHDAESRLVRVWFDTGKPHPAQRPGHRTTQLAIPVSTFLARAAKKPFAYYWDVVTQPPE